MYAAIDFGTTNTDVVIHSDNSGLNFHTFETQNVNLEFIDKIFKEISIDVSRIKSIAVTGGKSSNLENSYEEIPIEKINEIDAIALGAKSLYEINEDSFVVVSAGTGTACVHSNGVTHSHLGGISVGGGTLQGLSNSILGTSTQSNIDKLSIKGNRKNVDLLIGDVVNEI
jgi:type II pantothenate kinase